MPAVTPRTLRSLLRRDLQALSDRERALGMRRYMKSEMPYYGVASPDVKAICKKRFADLHVESFPQWETMVRYLWDTAAFREERYCVLQLVGHKSGRLFQTPEALPLYEHLIVDGAWWDYVDDIASHRLGPILLTHPREMKKAMRTWSRDDNMWKRRSAILCQITLKERTDLKLLDDCIRPSIASREFFLRKAIGWALRSYAWTDLRFVEHYLKTHPKLSPLSQREALKNAVKLKTQPPGRGLSRSRLPRGLPAQ